ncbi:MAG: hypothetical protein PF487_15100, partial [Bacteroidales bacterium]|nr:hypothetical protein [Bacteroidales bacterium]
ITTIAQNDTEYLYGRLVIKKTLEPVAYSHIINLRNNYCSISDSTGYFNIKARRTDTLLISAISYEYKKICFLDYPISEYSTYIFLKEKIYKIPEVRISYFGNYDDFKYKLLNLKLTEKTKINPLIFKMLPHNYSDVIPEPTIGSPISLLYNIFSKEGKSKRKLKELKIEQIVEANVRNVYNDHIIGQITGLKSDSLILFIKYCNFSNKYILETSQYNLYMQIKNKFDAFKMEE